MPYHENVVFYKTGWSRQYNQSTHSEVALEGLQCTVETTKDQQHYPGAHPDTRLLLELHTPIYLNPLSTIGQKKNWRTFKIIPPTPAICNLSIRHP